MGKELTTPPQQLATPTLAMATVAPELERENALGNVSVILSCYDECLGKCLTALTWTATYQYSVDPHLESLFDKQKQVIASVTKTLQDYAAAVSA